MALEDVKRICIVGSLRRRKETVGGIDVIVASLNPEYVMDSFPTISHSNVM